MSSRKGASPLLNPQDNYVLWPSRGSAGGSAPVVPPSLGGGTLGGTPFSRRLIAFSACLCPVAVLGCAAMISWTWAARFVPIHPWHAGSSGIY